MNQSRPRFSKPLLFALIGIGVALVGFTGLHFTACVSAFADSCDKPLAPPTATAVSEVLAPGYYTYTPAALGTAQRTGIAVLYFWAPWCSSCTSLDIELQDKKASIPEGITVLRVDYDQAQELRAKYNVVTQHTFVQVDAAGNALSTWVGGDIEELEALVP